MMPAAPSDLLTSEWAAAMAAAMALEVDGDVAAAGRAFDGGALIAATDAAGASSSTRSVKCTLVIVWACTAPLLAVLSA